MSEWNSVVRVMIVEDEEATQRHVAAAISADPRTKLLARASTAREAIALLPQASPDVLLVDLGLPDIHGTEVIRFAARTLPECDIMVITVFGDERNAHGHRSGRNGYVLKDFDNTDLLNQILELRAGGAPMSPGVARLVLSRREVAPPLCNHLRRAAPPLPCCPN